MTDSSQGTRRRYESSMLDEHPAAAAPLPSPDQLARATTAGWSEELLQRVLAVRPDGGMVDDWIDNGWPAAEGVEAWVETQERLLSSTLVGRVATWADHDMLADLWANAPEQIGDWTVTVERSPNPFAQFRLQEHPDVHVLEDRRVALGMSARSIRNSIVGGERTSVHFMSAWRIRDGFRGTGLSRLLQNAAGQGTAWFGLVTYYYVRPDNSSLTWIESIEHDMADRPEAFRVENDQLTATVTTLRGSGERSVRVRETTEDDLDACLELINRTHDGLDLFRPYTMDYLRQRLDDPSWGPKPRFYPSIYGWPDHRVLEVDGEVVACGGLWDRGRDVREIWERDDVRIVHDPTAVLDFGFAVGQDEAMAELVGHLAAESTELGRSGVNVALQFLPDVADHLTHLEPTVDVRELHTNTYHGPDLTLDLPIRRPYTDLAYW